jgi:antitoxin MazE
MKTTLVRIGNSRGIRIPKAIVEQCGLAGDIDLQIKGGTVVIAPRRTLRAGWAEAFKRAAQDDDEVAAGDVANEFDDKEWRW